MKRRRMCSRPSITTPRSRAFAAFLQKNPHSRLIAPATYHLGESYYYQSRHREAAEQFLKIATDFSKSPVAPDAMVKLGVSLNALGAKEQACAFFSELPRKYPNASGGGQDGRGARGEKGCLLKKSRQDENPLDPGPAVRRF